EQIMKMFDTKEDVEYVAKSVNYNVVAENDYNLSVSSYVEAKDTREVINIKKLNSEIETTVAKINKLRAEINKIVEVIES
ncbi:MAG: N-6 DNA methylase, partial [Lentisphaeria bacterium]